MIHCTIGDFTFKIDDDCSTCRATIGDMCIDYNTQDTNFYGIFDLKTNAIAKSFVLSPDRNIHGIVTHYHINPLRDIADQLHEGMHAT